MRPLLFCVAIAQAACMVGEPTIDELVDDALARNVNPCDDKNIRDRANVRKVNGQLTGTNGADVIVGTKGADRIFGNGGDDLICGLDGDDYIDGGDGRDRIWAGAGADIVHGRGGSDKIWGEAGPDVLFGDILDDDVYGGDGNDVMIGGHGTDILEGAGGNDVIRGDTGNDSFDGGAGNDTVSFATALPPGQPDNETNGVHIRGNLSDGDGGDERLADVENIVGSSFQDDIRGAITPAKTLGQVFMQVTRNPAGDPIDVGVVVLGTPNDDTIEIRYAPQLVIVTGDDLTVGYGCDGVRGRVTCPVGGNFHFVTAWGDDGKDTITFSGDWPREFEAHASGGAAADHLIGGEEQDVFFTGTTGTDRLEGRGGDDALLSESRITEAFKNGNRPRPADYDGGGDILDGGNGNDQLVADYVCGGHTFIGGNGRDIAGFARSGRFGIHAQLAGPASFHSDWWGFAANMDLCPNRANWTEFKNKNGEADLEVLEASDGPDRLWGDDRNNVLWGRGGGDHLYGLGGDDELLGADGRDVLDGGGGRNVESQGNKI
ncbi:MAG: calcium-binding protein [Kofleriaceae bacterium]